jgi:transketolase
MIDRTQRRDLPEGWDSALPILPTDAKDMAARDSSGKVLNAIAEKMPWRQSASCRERIVTKCSFREMKILRVDASELKRYVTSICYQ